MIQKLEAKGVKGEGASWEWDDGSDHDDVTKIYVRYGLKGIRYIYFDYVKSGQLKEGAFHGLLKSGCTQIFEINHLKDEHLEAVEGYYTESDGIQALRFRTNFKTSELMGSDDKGTKFSLEVNGKKIVGFHGSRNSSRLNSLGAYFTWITPTKLEAKGGMGGKEWNDGYDHDNLTKIHVHGGAEGIQFIRFSYVKNRQVEEGPIHGFDGQGFTQTFEINHLNNEYLVTVDGYYDAASGVIQGLQFKTNIKTFKMMGYEKGRKFSVAANGNKIIGFHGYSEKSGLHSLGAYFTTDPPSKLDCLGLIGPFSVYWDDGSNYDGIRKVFVNVSTSRYVTCIRFEYDNGGKFEKVHRRDDVKDEKEFALEYPYEFITSMEMSIKGSSATDKWISSLKIKTSKGRSSPTFGKLQSTKVVLEKKDNALVGFYGWSTSTTLNALGAYYRPLPPPSNAKTLKAEGGDGGVSWDDGGNFDGVRKIFIGLSHNAVAFVKFMYYKDARMVFGDDHGSKTLFDDEEFELNYPDEYLISVEGASNSSGVITMLRFKTNKQTSPAFGFGTTSSFLLHNDDHIIVGFHGRSDNMLLHQVGVHVIPISNHIHI